MTLVDRIFRFPRAGTPREGSSINHHRTITFRLIENAISTADAFLDLGELTDCDHYLALAGQRMEELMGTEGLVLQEKLRLLLAKRAKAREV